MVTKTPEEFATLSPDQVKAYLADEEKTVFGRTQLDEPAFKRVNGAPVEMGIGAPGRENHNHLASIRRFEGEDAYRAAVDAIWKRNPAHAEKLGLKRRSGA